jgi:hypothetical protein
MDHRPFELQRFLQNVKVLQIMLILNTHEECLRSLKVILNLISANPNNPFLQATHASAAAKRGVCLVLELAPDVPSTLIGRSYILITSHDHVYCVLTFALHVLPVPLSMPALRASKFSTALTLRGSAPRAPGDQVVATIIITINLLSHPPPTLPLPPQQLCQQCNQVLARGRHCLLSVRPAPCTWAGISAAVVAIW